MVLASNPMKKKHRYNLRRNMFSSCVKCRMFWLVRYWPSILSTLITRKILVIYSFVRAPLVFLPGGLSPDTTLHALNSLNENLQVGRCMHRVFRGFTWSGLKASETSSSINLINPWFLVLFFSSIQILHG